MLKILPIGASAILALSPATEEFERCMARAELAYHVMQARLQNYTR